VQREWVTNAHSAATVAFSANGRRHKALPGATPSRYPDFGGRDQRRVADLIVRCLEHEGVTCVFGIPGEENIPLTDALSVLDPVTSWPATTAASFMAEIFGVLPGAPACARRPSAQEPSTLLLGIADATTTAPVRGISRAQVA